MYMAFTIGFLRLPANQKRYVPQRRKPPPLLGRSISGRLGYVGLVRLQSEVTIPSIEELEYHARWAREQDTYVR